MKIIDTIYIVIYNFGNKILKKCKEDARGSALTSLAILLVLLLTIISNIVGFLIIDNKFSSFITGGVVNYMIFYVLMGLFLYLIFRMRYKKVNAIDLLQEKFYSQTKQKQRLLNYAVLLFIASILVLSFATFRLYKFGYVL